MIQSIPLLFGNGSHVVQLVSLNAARNIIVIIRLPHVVDIRLSTIVCFHMIIHSCSTLASLENEAALRLKELTQKIQKASQEMVTIRRQQDEAQMSKVAAHRKVTSCEKELITIQVRLGE